MSPLDTYLGERSHWIPLGGGSGLLGALTSNQGPLLPLFLFSWGQGAPGSPFQIGGKAWATCCGAVPVSWLPDQAFFLMLLFRVPSGRLPWCFQVCSCA